MSNLKTMEIQTTTEANLEGAESLRLTRRAVVQVLAMAVAMLGGASSAIARFGTVVDTYLQDELNDALADENGEWLLDREP